MLLLLLIRAFIQKQTTLILSMLAWFLIALVMLSEVYDGIFNDHRRSSTLVIHRWCRSCSGCPGTITCEAKNLSTLDSMLRHLVIAIVINTVSDGIFLYHVT